MSVLHVVRANPLLTVQDGGRQGAMRYGVSQSGPMDWVRHRLALALAGATGAAFEVGIGGAEFAAEGPVRVAVAGPGFTVRAGDRTLEPPLRLVLADGERLAVVAGPRGMWASVAVTGINFGAPVLGSHSINRRTGMGERDFGRPFPCATAEPAPPELFLDPYADDGPVALLPGPQAHLFADDVRARLAAEPYRLTPALDRMGYRLEGPPLPASTHDIISDGIVEGAMQVPGDGQPIVQCADRAPTGGYPKIAIVAAADRPKLTQRRPGAEVRFVWEDVDGARRRRRELAARLMRPSPRIRAEFRSEDLAAQNLIDGVWSESA